MVFTTGTSTLVPPPEPELAFPPLPPPAAQALSASDNASAPVRARASFAVDNQNLHEHRLSGVDSRNRRWARLGRGTLARGTHRPELPPAPMSDRDYRG